LRVEEELKIARTEKKVYNKLLERQKELEQIIETNLPYNLNNINKYRYTECPNIVMKANKQLKKNETIIYIILQYELSDYESAIYGWCENKKDLKKQVIRDIINGEIKFNKKGDVISVYGYK
jgi:hypothetical protein